MNEEAITNEGEEEEKELLLNSEVTKKKHT
jgi:hypothetical protein